MHVFGKVLCGERWGRRGEQVEVEISAIVGLFRLASHIKMQGLVQRARREVEEVRLNVDRLGGGSRVFVLVLLGKLLFSGVPLLNACYGVGLLCMYVAELHDIPLLQFAGIVTDRALSFRGICLCVKRISMCMWMCLTVYANFTEPMAIAFWFNVATCLLLFWLRTSTPTQWESAPT